MNAITENKQGLKVLAAGAFLLLFMGIIYVWAVFVSPVSTYFGWEVGKVKLTASFMLCFFVIGILSGGKLQTIIGVKLAALIGGLMVAAGMTATAFIPMGIEGASFNYVSDGLFQCEDFSTPRAPIFLIYLFYGIIGGFGVGMAYNAIVSSAQKWFPKNRGFATGIVVCAFGLSTVIFAPVVRALTKNFMVNQVFLILAVVFAAATLALFSFIKSPEQAGGPPPMKGKQYTTPEMLKTSRYYLIMFSLMLGTSVFFIINPELMALAGARGLENFAVYVVMFTGITNAVGRLVIPLLSDKIGREAADISILAVTALSAFLLCFAQGALLIIAIGMVAFCFGGYPGLYAVLTSENFGMKSFGANYGMVMVGFMISAMFFPLFINRIESQTIRFAVLGGFAVIGAVLVLILKIINMKREKKDETVING